MRRDSLFAELGSRWIVDQGPDADVVITSRVRLARNLRGYPFPHLMQETDAKRMLQEVDDLVVLGSQHGDVGRLRLVRMADLDRLDREVLVEKHLISRDLARSRHAGAAMLVRDDEAISIMINEEDHLRIQCLLSGLQLEECYRMASRCDDWLEGRFEYAFDQTHGYLTACPTNVGTGLRASVMVHLPGLVMTQQIGNMLAAISKVGLVVRGLYGEGTESSGDVFQISNQITLGPSEEEILQNLGAVIRQLIEQERASRQAVLKAARVVLEDRVYRSYGVLTTARLLTSQESMRLLSDVKLGADLKLIDVPSARAFSQLLVMSQPAMVQRLADQQLGEAERDQKRAELVRERLQAKD
jgi:protein arginine kinase